jgi:hypothetical protein
MNRFRRLFSVSLLLLLPCIAMGQAGTGVPDQTAAHFPSPVLYCVPAASATGGTGAMVCSAISDDGNFTYDTEPLKMSSPVYLLPTNVATSSANYVSNATQYVMSYFNAGGAAVNTGWTVYGWVGTGTTPATDLDFYGPPDLPSDAILYAINGGISATAIQNYNSPKFKVRGACWNGSTSLLADWNWQEIEGTGANPTETLLFTHNGCTGVAIVEVPGIKTDGTAYIGTGTASNTDVTGELSFSSATTNTYTLANLSTSHPECWIRPQFNYGTTAFWPTFTGGGASPWVMTINFSAAVTGNVSFGCLFRN